MQKRQFFQFLTLLVLAFSVMQCTPRISPELQEKREQAVKEDSTTQVLNDELSDCVKFSDIEKSEEALEAYVLYRDFFKLNQFDQALPYWRKAYRMAPAADGRRYVVYTDGVYLFEYLISQTEEEALERAYIDTILVLYDEAIECYPDYEGFLVGRKAYDVYYKYPDTYTDQQKLGLFQQAAELQGEKMSYFIVNPFTALLVEGFLNGQIDTTSTREWAQKLTQIISTQVKENPGNENWSIVEKYSLNQLERLEQVEGFYDCQYFKDKLIAGKTEEELFGDCENLLYITSQLNWAQCDASDSMLVALNRYLRDSCRVVPGGASGLAREGFTLMQDGKYGAAISKFSEAIDFAESDEKRAQYALMQAKICYSYTKDFPRSRTFARRAAQYDKDWGAPFILIGKLYASSGPLCGPGRGWDSQIVVWPAIDMWERAKALDPEVRDEAQTLINKYFEYMPTREDISKRLLTEGDDFTVGCWIQEKTTVRISRAY
jgi:tetratricopeptide (TPR) repeat protein